MRHATYPYPITSRRYPVLVIHTTSEFLDPAGCLLVTLPDWLRSRLGQAGRLADRMRLDIYLVGGIVRDLMLDIPNTDVDIVVEGDGLKFAQKLAKAFDAAITRHTRFGTATLTFQDETRMDIATARDERYEAPAALPLIEPNILECDLRRRDFSINAIALRLNRKRFGEVVDPFDGRNDIDQGMIRILHQRSFIDDPTRLIRAIRLEQRLGFSLEQDTKKRFLKAVKDGMVGRLSGRRLLDQLQRVCEEQDPWPVVARLDALGVFRAIHPSMNQTASTGPCFDAVRKWLNTTRTEARQDAEPWILYFIALLSPYHPKISQPLIERLHPTNRVLYSLRALPDMRRVALQLAEPPISNADVYRCLKSIPFDTVLYTGITSQDPLVRRHCMDYLNQLRHVRLAINGHTLHAMGIPQGAVYRRILDAVLYAKLNGEIRSAKEERNKAMATWKSIEKKD